MRSVLKNWALAMLFIGSIAASMAVVLAPTIIPCLLFEAWGLLGLPVSIALFVLSICIAEELEDKGW